MREIIDYCAHLRLPTSRQACCTIMKKERRQKYRRKDSVQKKEGRKRKRMVRPSLIVLVKEDKKKGSRGGRHDKYWRCNPSGSDKEREKRVRAEGSRAGKVEAIAFGMDKQLCKMEVSKSVEVGL